MAVQPDGRIVIGGSFSVGYNHFRLARLNSDGSVDGSFTANPNQDVYCLAVQPDGKILVAGEFQVIGNTPRNYLARLNPDGSVDAGFNPAPSSTVYAMQLLPDGKILVGGYFLTICGKTMNRIARLNPDGSLDTTFIASVNGVVYSLAAQTNGQILVGGNFNLIDSYSHQYLARLNTNGALDLTFTYQPNNWVNTLAVQPDGKILAAGAFTSVGLLGRFHLARMNTNGTVDTNFSPYVYGFVNTMALQADGGILVGGSITNIGIQSVTNLARLNPNGSMDTNFNSGANGVVDSLALQQDGKILVGGEFSKLAGQTRFSMGRLNNTSSTSDNLTYDGSNIIWQRSGPGPEFMWTSFDASTNGSGTNLFSLGSGSRISGGWQLTGVSLPPGSTIRAHGYTTDGNDNASDGIIETGLGPPIITIQPVSLTNHAGMIAYFSVEASGAQPLSWQWYKDGAPLSDGPGIINSQKPSLVCSNVFGNNAGNYWVVITNASGSVTSQVVSLQVQDPYFALSPTVQTVNIGGTVGWNTSTAVGSAPLSYQWYKNGVVLPGATASSYVMSNVQPSEVGFYSVVISNQYGSVSNGFDSLLVNESLPESFNTNADLIVSSLLIQTNHQIVATGNPMYGGVTTAPTLRFNEDGTLDPSFSAAATIGGVCLAEQTNGQILIADYTLSISNQLMSTIGRVNPDGTLDSNLNPQADNGISCMALQADGKILLGGWFTNLDGKPHPYLGRVNADGSVDTSFTNSPNSDVACIAIQPDNKILIGGDFYMVGNVPAQRIARLNPDGTLDSTFNSSANSKVQCMLVQPDGKILVGGIFTNLSGQSRSYLGRLNPNGTMDASFNPTISSSSTISVCSLALQADGKLLVGGSFNSVGSFQGPNLGRLNPDGTLDQTFNVPVLNSIYVPAVYCLGIQDDGKILLGGVFNNLAGITQATNFGRLTATAPATQQLSFDGYSITWLRGGTSPEVWRTTFELSTDGTNWSGLGAGTHINGGWQLTGIMAPTNAILRARGFVVGGEAEASSWFVQTTLAVNSSLPPKILAGNPGFGTNQFGFSITGLTGQTIILEGSTDLKTWQPLATNAIGNSPLQFTDAASTNFTQRFYRARLQ